MLYTSAGLVTSNFNDSCGLGSPYSGTGAGCDDPATHPTGCKITQIAGPFNTYWNNVTYYSSGVAPGPLSGWQLTSTTTGTIDVQLTTFGGHLPGDRNGRHHLDRARGMAVARDRRRRSGHAHHGKQLQR